MISARKQTVALCLTVGLLGVLASAVPAGLQFEETAGLDWLFSLRGPIAPPSEVVLVSIDSDSAAALDQHPNPDRWPRSLHAQLTNQLIAAGAAIIVFDLYFVTPRDTVDDRNLADAIRDAGNVVLLEKLGIDSVASADRTMLIEKRDPPIPELRRAALATAPFPLPVVPIKVSQFWVFGPTDPSILTLPAVALHAYALDVHDEFVSLLREVRPGAASWLATRQSLHGQGALSNLGSQIRALFASDTSLAKEMRSRLSEAGTGPGRFDLSDAERSKLHALIDLYAGGDTRYLNLYGPAGTISTIPYDAALDQDPASAASAFNGKVVFVGYSDEQPIDQQDEFNSVFSDSTGVRISGAEIGATAFANLLLSNDVRPLPIGIHLLLVFLWGAAIAAALLWLPLRIAIGSLALATLGYVALSHSLFQSSNLWLPIMVPLAGQIPVALIGAFVWRYSQARVQSEKHRRTLGLYLPPQVVDELSRNRTSSRPQTKLQHGTCLATDIEEYTLLSERLPPAQLHSLLNEYYALLFSEVKQRGGFVADIVGDSMVAVWTSADPDPALSSNACLASLAILDAVDRFNASRAEYRLPTRIGVHTGELLLGDIGADSHFEYRAVGDIVNTASRIQDLNKRLGTNLLVSEDALAEAHCSWSRLVGRFLLPGKTVPLSIYDAVHFEQPPPESSVELARQFGKGLDHFYARRWRPASKVFEQLLDRFHTDGPSRFYLQLCRAYLVEEPDAEWRGIIAIDDK